jgi:two-component system capsular synthesis sensor histidine kinase RcsC
MKILVCEDNKLTLRSIELALHKAGYSVIKAADGRQGIKILEEEMVDLLITDINMPYSLGLELVRYVNTQLEEKIPVIIVTGITQKETEVHAMELGVQAYIKKPLDLDVLVDMVKQLTEIK